jgi:hypothetical protein
MIRRFFWMTRARVGNWLGNLGIVLFVLFWASLAWFALFHESPEAAARRKEQAINHNEPGAEVACEHYVRNQLHAPASARVGDEQTQNLGGGRYRVTSFVDAQNLFGALIRTRYVCEAWTFDGASFTVNAQF